MQRISGKNFDISIGDLAICVSKTTLTIEDKTEVAKDGGVPNGWVDGEVAASGDLELDALVMSLLGEAAKAVGSWRALDTFDMLFYAKTAQHEEMKVEAFGCKLVLDSLLDVDKAGGQKHISKVKYLVTSPDFIRINGVPYLRAEETEGLVSNS
ncbi:phage protein [uncultured Desulfovibrio sp.]|uniref:phage protein n=1 Tax=uncultured Desulfovibrio sp. TaxID=167968 RepID=UPI0026708D46|nr:phage protein [uncultured Desulfovibrio sp.]